MICRGFGNVSGYRLSGAVSMMNDAWSCMGGLCKINKVVSNVRVGERVRRNRLHIKEERMWNMRSEWKLTQTKTEHICFLQSIKRYNASHGISILHLGRLFIVVIHATVLLP